MYCIYAGALAHKRNMLNEIAISFSLVHVELWNGATDIKKILVYYGILVLLLRFSCGEGESDQNAAWYS